MREVVAQAQRGLCSTPFGVIESFAGDCAQAWQSGKQCSTPFGVIESFAVPEGICMFSSRMATANPCYGYKRIAAMCGRSGQAVKDRHAYAVMRQAGQLQQARPREPELYQAARLFELLPQKPNDMYRMDGTYIHILGHG